MFQYSKNRQHEPLPDRCPIRVHAQKLPLVQFHLLCMIGLGGFVTAFSGRAEFVQTNAGARANHADMHNDTGATLMARNGSSGAIYGNYGAIGSSGAIYERPAVTTPIANSTKRENVAKATAQVAGLQHVVEPNTGVLILGGLALLLWIQRLRRHWI
jgi:hypothetical protein